MTPTIHHGDCLEVMAGMPENSVDAIVTDPPYGLGFMGRKWDALPPGQEWAEACLRVLKPGGHLLAFGGTRTWHRLAVAIEDAGFEMRDSLAWLYGSGFPKSHDVSKGIDKLAGAERVVTGEHPTPAGTLGNGVNMEGGASREVVPLTVPATPEAVQWDGWGTALKPAFEPIIVARKPLTGTVAANTLEWGVGGINIDACRIGLQDDENADMLTARSGGVRGFADQYVGGTSRGAPPTDMSRGRWPANVVLDEYAAAELDQQSGVLHSQDPATRSARRGTSHFGSQKNDDTVSQSYADRGGASRFMYVAKAPKRERPNVDGVQHPTVKPLALMRWLVRLVTPPGGTVLDPFAGSGTTIEAALIERFNPIGIEMTDEYLPLIQHRIERQNTA